jgi:hypothetical protein
MKFGEYVAQLQEFLEKNPDASEYTTVFSRDDEGNGFNVVHYTATVGNFDGERDGEFISGDRDMEEYEVEPNAVCIN